VISSAQQPDSRLEQSFRAPRMFLGSPSCHP